MTLKKSIAKSAIYPGSLLQQLQRRANKGIAVKIAKAVDKADPLDHKSVRATAEAGEQDE